MNRSNNNYKAVINRNNRNLYVLAVSIVIGILVGLTVVAYRLVLGHAEELSFIYFDYFKTHPVYVPLLFAALAAGGYLVGLIITRFTMTSGSGIPQVKGIITGHFNCNWFSTLIAKFFGGALSILGGLSLGREGPSIQLGACVAQGVVKKIPASRAEKKIFIASGASAGLAAAFNAPLAGVMFAMEEVFRYFSPTILLATTVSAVTADFISKMIFGLSPVFDFDIQESIPLSKYWLLVILGGLVGLAGASYNFMLVGASKLYKKISFLSSRTRPVLAFLIAGALGLLFPVVIGGGHFVINRLSPSSGITVLVLILTVKFLFSMVSYGSGAPGGIFFPLLVMGATIGAIFGDITVNYFGVDSTLFYNFMILAMAGFFTAIVRAPITGVILLLEMTGSLSHLLSLAITSIAAYVAADLLKSTPIYHSLLELQLANIDDPQSESADTSRQVGIEMVVHHGSKAENRLVKDLELPGNCLLISVRRRGKDQIPKGMTKVMAEDFLVVLTNTCSESKVRAYLESITSHI